MLIEDPSAFALILLNRDGTAYLRRALDYLQRVEFPGQIVISDSSQPGHAAFAAASPGAYPGLRITVVTLPHALNFFAKLEATLQQVSAEFVLACANDDFVVPAVVDRCVAALGDDAGLACARGRSVMFELVAPAAAGGSVGVGLSLYPMRGYPQAGCVERTLEMLRNFSTTLYSVHRRELLRENLRYTVAHGENTIFQQYLFATLSAAQGRILCLDEPFYIRQGRADSLSGQMRRESYEHWPLLITSPEFSRLYQKFRQALLAFVARHAGGPLPDTLPADFDAAAVGLMRRGFCGQEFDNPEDAAFFERTRAGGTQENALLRDITRFASDYPDTY
jgi:glycosyltransferase domain-containing protein